MKNKVFINRVNIDYKTLYAKAQDYFKRHGVDISFDFVNCDYKNLSTITRHFSQGNRVILQPTMSNIVSIDPTYDFTSFVFNGREFGTNIPTGYTYCPLKQPFMDILTDELNPVGLDYVTICHEMMHALVFKANLTGYPTNDIMDTYYKAMELEAPDSNFGQQWALLKPFIASLNTPQAPTCTLTRNSDDGIQTLGTLQFGAFICKTLERPWLLNQANVSAIPKGTYNVKWTFSFKFMRYTYEVQNVLNRTGIRIHSASFWYNLKGCIALGSAYKDIDGDNKLDLINSRITVKSFEDLMQKKPFILIIK